MTNGNSKIFYAALLWTLIAINIVGFATAGIYHVTRPYEIDYDEGIVIYQANRKHFRKQSCTSLMQRELHRVRFRSSLAKRL